MRDFHLPGRSTAHGAHGMIATSHPLASLAGLDMLRAGGTAADAAVAAAAMLAVVEPAATGIGGDAFCLVAPKGSAAIEGYNGSGAAPRALTLDRFAGTGLARIPLDSPHAVTVPGAVDLWLALLARHGRLPLDQILAPAIVAAHDGFVVTPRVGSDWAQLAPKLARDAHAARHLLIDGAAPRVGQIMRQPALGDTLARIAAHGRAGFYEGPVASDMVASLNALGGTHGLSDFAEHRGEWVTPIATDYRGVRVHEIPPNGQGVTTLLMLNILETFDLAGLDPHGPERFHLEVEATRLAYRERDAHIADPRHAAVPLETLLDKDFARTLAAGIDPARAGTASPKTTSKRDTTYLSLADAEGTMISFINSLYHGFGSGLASAASGVVFQNRGSGFVLDPAHPNRLAGGKRPFHTIIPALATRDGRPWMAFGVMGGDYQPVGQTHVLTNIVDHGMDAQEALDSPRAFWEDGVLSVERGVSGTTREALARMGHVVAEAASPFGGGQIVLRDEGAGTWTGASEPRKDGIALGY